MNLDKKTTFKIMLIIFSSILFTVAIANLGVVAAGIGKFLGVLSPFIIGLCLAFILNIPLKLIEEKCFAPLNRKGGRVWKKLKRPVSLLLAILCVLIIIALLLVIIIPQFKKTIEGFAVSLPSYMDALNEKLSDIMSKITGKEGESLFKIDWETVSNMLIEFVHKNESDTVGITLEIISGAVGAVFDIVLGIVFSIYILASKERLGRQFRSVLYSVFKKKKVDRFMSVMSMANTSFSRFVVGQFTEAVIIGVLCCIGMFIFRMPYAPVISCIIAITALIPVFGAFIGTAIGAFMILLVSPIKALWFVVYIIVLQQLETNIIYPKVVGKSVGLPGIWVLFAVMIGGGFFGAFGMLVAVPIFSVLYTLLDIWVRKRLIARNIDSNTLHRRHRPISHKDDAEETEETEPTSDTNEENN
ncbi:MAG: AI-2E family transporter [Clostridia bacterium]|nr:AI-2E family transporter [Clostridia bacterium]